MKRTIITSLLTGITLLIFTACGSTKESNSSQDTTPTSDVKIVDSTTITALDGRTIRVDKTEDGFIFRGYEGKIVLLEVYGDTCPHCIAAIPYYNKIQAKYPNDVVVIALESYGSLNNASKQQYITVPKNNTGKMFPFIQSLTGYHLQAVPYLMILARDGSIVYDGINANFPEETIESQIQSLL